MLEFHQAMCNNSLVYGEAWTRGKANLDSCFAGNPDSASPLETRAKVGFLRFWRDTTPDETGRCRQLRTCRSAKGRTSPSNDRSDPLPGNRYTTRPEMAKALQSDDGSQSIGYTGPSGNLPAGTDEWSGNGLRSRKGGDAQRGR